MELLSEKENNESYIFGHMLKQKDTSDFIHTMIKEADDHEMRNHWKVVHRSDKTPGVKTILSIWYLRRKRFPDGRINKHKARLCAHGGIQQYGVNYWEIYSSTMNWISVQFLMIFAQISKLDTKAIGFVLAFTQDDLDFPVYMDLPAGMYLAGHGKDSSKYLLKLKKYFYGLITTYLNWRNKLKDAFEDRFFVESLSDPCVFISKKMIILLYVDDCILISKEGFTIKKFIDSMKDSPEGLAFTEEGTMHSYLGVYIPTFPDEKGFTFSQTFYIYRIVQALGFDPKTTKGATRNTLSGYLLLNKDENGPARKASWKYRAIIGMLGYF